MTEQAYARFQATQQTFPGWDALPTSVRGLWLEMIARQATGVPVTGSADRRTAVDSLVMAVETALDSAHATVSLAEAAYSTLAVGIEAGRAEWAEVALAAGLGGLAEERLAALRKAMVDLAERCPDSPARLAALAAATKELEHAASS